MIISKTLVRNAFRKVLKQEIDMITFNYFAISRVDLRKQMK